MAPSSEQEVPEASRDGDESWKFWATKRTLMASALPHADVLFSPHLSLSSTSTSGTCQAALPGEGVSLN